jgi:Fic family protein
MLKETYQIPALPPPGVTESIAVLKEAARAHRYLAELKGCAAAMPNPLIDTLSLQEAKASSEIENIVTTQDEMFQASLFPDTQGSPAAKEVALYAKALLGGFERMGEQHGLLTNNNIISMFQTLKRSTGGFRNTPGTALRNEASGEIVFVPPQHGDDIIRHMTVLEAFINDDASTLDPLVRMAIIHHQFESIHPFPDGNGRIGRIINVLYLTKEGLLDFPILYLSRFITASKPDYYRLLRQVGETGEWEPWLLYMIRGVGETARTTLDLIDAITALMAETKQRLRADHAKLYSQDLLNNLFRHPYTRIEFVQRDLGVTRQTAARYLEQLVAGGLLEKQQAGRNSYFVNAPLVALFTGGPPN